MTTTHTHASEVSPCSVAEIFDDAECDALITEYIEECACSLIGKPAPNREYYEHLASTGMAFAFAAWEDGKLCGFAFLLTPVIPHYDLRIAVLESLFVSKRASAGAALMRRVEEFARQSGYSLISLSAPVGSRLARLLFLQSDLYINTHHVFCKRLK